MLVFKHKDWQSKSIEIRGDKVRESIKHFSIQQISDRPKI